MKILNGFIAFLIVSWIAIFAVIVVVTIISLPFLALNAKSCSMRSDGIGRHKYSIISGCLVEPSGHEGFIPLESYKFIDGEDGE